jgi:hypothetical protein
MARAAINDDKRERVQGKEAQKHGDFKLGTHLGGCLVGQGMPLQVIEIEERKRASIIATMAGNGMALNASYCLASIGDNAMVEGVVGGPGVTTGRKWRTLEEVLEHNNNTTISQFCLC